MRIEECLPCPRCGRRRILQRGRTYFCFHCRYGWSAELEPVRVEHSTSETVATFTRDELRRLIAYRAAIRAGLYTDLA